MVTTPESAASVRAALSGAFARLASATPSDDLLGYMMAQTALETGRWQSLKNFNLGNITAAEVSDATAWRPPWFAPPFATERDAELHEKMLRGAAPRAFMSYPNLESGAFDYVRRLHTQFPEIVTAMETGDARKVATAINHNYCRGCFEVEHTRSLRSLAEEFGARGRAPIRSGHFGFWMLGIGGSYLLARWGLKK